MSAAVLPPVATHATGPIQWGPVPRHVPSATVADLPPDPCPGVAWPLYPVHHVSVLEDGGRSRSYRQRRSVYPCCGHTDHGREPTGDLTEVTCMGREVARLTSSWAKRARYALAGWILPLPDSPTDTVRSHAA